MKSIFITLCFLVSIGIVNACDFCNCYVSINPLLKKNFVGVRYHFSPYSLNNLTESEIRNLNLNKKDFQELKSIYELHGQFYPIKKLQVLVMMPYVVNSENVFENSEPSNEHTHEPSQTSTHTHTPTSAKENSFTRHIVTGIGDPIVLTNYNIYDKQGNDTFLTSHSLFIGGGIKVPIGRYQIAELSESHERLHLPGTGSFDYLLNINYIVKRKLTGVSINSNYLIAGTNNQQYKYGNRFNGKASVFREFKRGYLYIFPNIGPYIEIADKDAYNHVVESNTGGMILNSQAALDIYYKNFSLNIEFQLPIVRQLNGIQSQLDYRFISGITYAFN
jgi:hypothetical protein